MARRKLTLTLGPIVAAVGRAPASDDLTTRILDAAADHLRRHGLARWSMDDVADVAGVGRTTVYRWFGSREELIHQVLARELRATIAAASQAAESTATFEDRIVESAAVCLEALDGSVVDHLLQTDPVAVLPLLTTEAAPLLSLARIALAPRLLSAGLAETPEQAELAAEAIARLGLSFVLTRDSIITGDRRTLRAAVRTLLAEEKAKVGAAEVQGEAQDATQEVTGTARGDGGKSAGPSSSGGVQSPPAPNPGLPNPKWADS